MAFSSTVLVCFKLSEEREKLQRKQKLTTPYATTDVLDSYQRCGNSQ